MRKGKKYLLFFAFVFISIRLIAQPSVGVYDQYEYLLEGSKAVEMLDSMANSKFFHSYNFTENKNYKHPYSMPANHIPEYNDSLLQERIAAMNAASPFEFRYNNEVRAHIDFYLKRRSFIARLLGLTELYFPMFEELLDKYGLPLELKYLPIIESALNPLAKSKAGAAGLWQFMYKTGLMYGLQSDSYVEDRFDPYKATDAACRHLKDLYAIYGDWALCLAAYNAGAGRINRTIKQCNDQKNYWKIQSALPKETQRYVPAFIAAAYVFTYYAEHNIRPMVPVLFDTEVDTVSARAELSFLVISNMLDIPIEQVELLNPAYKKQIIPAPAGEPYKLRIPKNKMLKFIEIELDMYYMNYAVKYPDLMANYMTKSGLTVNTKYVAPDMLIPAPADSNKIDTEIVLKTISSPEQLLKIINSSDLTAITPKTTTTTTSTSSTTTTTSSPTGVHVVQRGESLGIIAQKYGCTIEQIKQWNGLTDNTIHPGQKLKVSGTKTSSPATTTTTTTTTAGAKTTWYTVKSGDSLWSIANKHSTTVDKIKADNNLNSNSIQPGQKLKIVTGK